MKVIYLVGMGRSGSTLLDILLDAHSNIRALGGVRRLAHYARKHPCPCGARSFYDCAFWGTVNAELERRIGRNLETLDVHSRDPAIFRRDNKTLFEVVAEVAGVEYVTDNSKSVSRLRRLMAIPDLEVVPIHNLRDARGRAASVEKRKQQLYIPNLTYSHRAWRLYRLLNDKPHVVVHYEQLAENPRPYMEALMERLGIPFEEQQLAWFELPHHNIGSADVLRAAHSSEIRPDIGWEKKLKPHQQTLINLIAWPGRALNERKARRWGVNRD